MEPIADDDATTQAHCERSRFLQALLDDEERGRLQPVEHYLAIFPGLAEFVRAEYSALTQPANANDLPETPRNVGRYRIVGELGAGGMGAVYEALDPQLGRRVVMKTLHPGMVRDAKAQERLRREARVLGALDHPNLATIIDVVEAEDRLHLVMPFHEGRTLGAYITAARSETDGTGEPSFVRLAGAVDRAAALRQLLQCFVAAALALHKGHEAGVVHRDIKPENLLVRPDGSPVVLDFGLALPDEEGRLTSVGEVLGTPLYMAPEQIEGAVATPRTDVYALGVVLYEALTLVHPFAGSGGRAATFQRILAGDPVPPRRHLPLVSRDLEAVVLRAMERNAARRYPNAAALAKDLQRVFDLEPTEARPLSGMTATWRRVRRQPKVAVLGVLLFAALVLLASQHLSQRLSEQDLHQDMVSEGIDPAVAAKVIDRNRNRLSVPADCSLLIIAPRGSVLGIDRVAWMGYSPKDPKFGGVLRHSYQVQVFNDQNTLVWSKVTDQDPATRRCEELLPTGIILPRGTWTVQWIGATDAAGNWEPRIDGDPDPIETSFEVEPKAESLRAKLPPQSAANAPVRMHMLLEAGCASDVLHEIMFSEELDDVATKQLLSWAIDASVQLRDEILEETFRRQLQRLEKP